MKTNDIFFPIRYLPKKLTKKDKKIYKNELLKSRKLYKKSNYYTRKYIPSFKSKQSKHLINAKKLYNIENITPNNLLSKKTKCSLKSLKKIVNKGEGAYYSSGSRPNQTARSWGLARLASAITGQKASVVDYEIIKKGCSKNGKVYKLANKALQKFGKTLRKTPKVL